MNILKIYLADNGDIFFQHDSLYQEKTHEEVIELMKSANSAYLNKTVEFIKCNAIECKEPIQHLKYKTDDGEFIGEAGMHITKEFDVFQNMIYLKRVSERTDSNDLNLIISDDLISIADYAELHGVKADTVRQKILRGKLDAVKIGRNWCIARKTPYIDNRSSINK